MKPFKVAILLTGQSRTFKVGIQNILNYFNIKVNDFTKQKVEVDYFVHTWDTNSYRDKTKQRWEGDDYLLDPITETEIQNAFNPVLMEYEKYNAADFNNVWSPLFYSLMKVVQLKRKYEIENDFVYDLVIKSRFDLNFSLDPFPRFGFMTNKFYVHPTQPFSAYSSAEFLARFPKEFNTISFDDVFFYSDSPTMDIIGNAFRWQHKVVTADKLKLNSNEIMDETIFNLGPGTTLYRHLINWQIYPTGEVTTPYYIVRKEAEDKQLDGVKNWKEIHQISVDWYGDNFGQP
jgi:hypothetical protein